jgi:hypothetical protein
LENFQELKKTFFENLGDFHSWDGGKTWNHGGFDNTHLRYFTGLVESISNCEIIETGSGNSTVAFLLGSPKRVDSISPDYELWSRIESYCKLYQIPTERLNPIKDQSEWALPGLAIEESKYDIGLIDGGHGWPTTFIDLYYIYFMLRKNGYLIMDDIQLYSVKEMANLLIPEVDKLELVVNLGKTLVFRKLTDENELGDWAGQKYIVEKTNELTDFGHKFALYDTGYKNYRMLGYRKSYLTKPIVFVIRVCAWILAKTQGKLGS